MAACSPNCAFRQNGICLFSSCVSGSATKPATMNSTAKPLFFILVVAAILVGYSFIAERFRLPVINGTHFLSDVTTEKDRPMLAGAKRTVPPAKAKDSNNAINPYRDYLTYNGIVTYEADRKFALSKFISALKSLKAGKRKKVRIAYFGDSMIEGDLITEDLRRMLQDSFGGSGVGFVPVTSVVSGFRQTVMHSYSSNWKDENFLASPKATQFLSGHIFTADTFSTVQYGTVPLPHLQRFEQAGLLYGKASRPLTLTVNGKNLTLPATSTCNKTVVAEACVQLKIKNVNATPLYGFSFEDTAGVYLDNYAFRGSSGMDLGNLSTAFLKQIGQVHDYDLIVFQYGPNLFTPTASDFVWYEKPMLGVMEKFKTAFPEASLLVVSTADKAYRYNGEMGTAVGVEPLLEAQANFAAAGGVNLWNLYRAMGGRNSMLNWVEGDSALARKDYTHFTYAGAKRVAGMLFTAMMQEYALAN